MHTCQLFLFWRNSSSFRSKKENDFIMCSCFCSNLCIVMYRKFRNVPLFKFFSLICSSFWNLKVGKYALCNGIHMYIRDLIIFHSWKFLCVWSSVSWTCKFIRTKLTASSSRLDTYSGGFFKKNCTGMLKVEFKISTISIPRKAWFCDPSLYHFSAKSTQFGAKLDAYLAKFSKIHPILQIGRIGYVTITHPSIYQTLRKYTSKPLSIPVYHLSVRTPPPGTHT